MSRLIKGLVLVLLLAALVAPVLGCGVGTTAEQNNRTIGRVWDYDARMMTDDLGELVLCERPFRGSRYPIK